MNVRRWVVRAGGCAIMALAAVPIRGFAGDVPPDAHAQMRAAMDWLATPWSEAQQKTLEARQPPKDPKALLHLPGSIQTYRREQLSQIVPDWWPHDHPPMPTIVAAGRGKGMPCGECHGPTGAGEPHTATLMGLPAAYIIEQVRAFRDGSRANDEMHFEASHVSDADVQQAAAYFTGLHLAAARARVIEAARVPATHIQSWMLVSSKGGASEPIGDRIIELPLDQERIRMGDARARFIAYVPPGSVARGHLLASGGADGITACTSCHGADLRGVANAPPLAGRSPTYLTRQLVQVALGNRQGTRLQPMQQVVSHLTLKDMISAAAYAATLKP
jgi:cytochrome c553